MKYCLYFISVASFFLCIATKDSPEVTANPATVETQKSLLRELKEQVENKCSAGIQQVKEHPWLSTATASLIAALIYKKNPRVQEAVHKGYTQSTTLVKDKILVPSYLKYEEIKALGLTPRDVAYVILGLAGCWGIKRAHDNYNLMTVSKSLLSKSGECMEVAWKKHPYILFVLLASLGITATAFQMYKLLVVPMRKRSISSIDNFLLNLDYKVRNALIQFPQLQELIIKGDLSALVENEAFNEFTSSLSQEEQDYLYERINQQFEVANG